MEWEGLGDEREENPCGGLLAKELLTAQTRAEEPRREAEVELASRLLDLCTFEGSLRRQISLRLKSP